MKNKIKNIGLIILAYGLMSFVIYQGFLVLTNGNLY